MPPWFDGHAVGQLAGPKWPCHQSSTAQHADHAGYPLVEILKTWGAPKSHTPHVKCEQLRTLLSKWRRLHAQTAIRDTRSSWTPAWIQDSWYNGHLVSCPTASTSCRLDKRTSTWKSSSFPRCRRLDSNLPGCHGEKLRLGAPAVVSSKQVRCYSPGISGDTIRVSMFQLDGVS